MSNEDKAADKVVADCYDCADLIGLDRDIQKLVHIVNARVTVFGPQWEVRLVKFQELKALLTAASFMHSTMRELLSQEMYGEHIREGMDADDLKSFDEALDGLNTALQSFKEFE